MSEYYDALLERRSMYEISGASPLPDDELAEKLRGIIKNLPTAYNMQSTRLVLLLGAEHKTLWDDIVLETLRGITKPERFPKTQEKIAGFSAGYGSLLFFDDGEVTERFKAENSAFADKFDGWVLQHGGMLQLACWVYLEDAGFGASLQHYNPLIDDEVKARWQLPQKWTLLAQMPFGKPTGPAGEKEFEDIDKRFKVFGQG